MPTDPSKIALRDQIKPRLAAISPADAAAWSAQICARIIGSNLFRDARTLMLFASIHGEVDLRPVASIARDRGKSVCLPRTDWANRLLIPALADMDRLVRGRHGLMEPPADAPITPVSQVDLLFVPGLAYDLAGNRLGRGAGFYDRFLADPALAAPTCAAAFDLQVVDSVPVTAHDIPIQWIVTPTRLVATGAWGRDNP